jgi:hypothetical protein
MGLSSSWIDFSQPGSAYADWPYSRPSAFAIAAAYIAITMFSGRQVYPTACGSSRAREALAGTMITVAHQQQTALIRQADVCQFQHHLAATAAFGL